jgi:hypothetical protein
MQRGTRACQDLAEMRLSARKGNTLSLLLLLLLLLLLALMSCRGL